MENLISLSQKNLFNVMYKFLASKYKNVIKTKDYIYAIGDAPIALIAHLDTVFELKNNKNRIIDLYYDREKQVMFVPQGPGFDDRAGVFAIIKIIRKGYRPHIIFTTNEEAGCLGAIGLVKDHPISPFKNLKYIIQLDRRGTNDCVFYDCANQKFTDYISSFGFVENFGSFSDISVICPAWGIAGVNLSVGYENEHSYLETLHITPLLATVDKVVKMLEASCTSENFVYINNSPYELSNWYCSDIKCSKCHKNFFDYEMFPVKGKNKKIKLLCPDCIVDDKIHWCEKCGEAFESDNKKENICGDCEKDGRY
jgi:hypothetical protein